MAWAGGDITLLALPVAAAELASAAELIRHGGEEASVFVAVCAGLSVASLMVSDFDFGPSIK